MRMPGKGSRSHAHRDRGPDPGPDPNDGHGRDPIAIVPVDDDPAAMITTNPKSVPEFNTSSLESSVMPCPKTPTSPRQMSPNSWLLRKKPLEMELSIRYAITISAWYYPQQHQQQRNLSRLKSSIEHCLHHWICHVVSDRARTDLLLASLLGYDRIRLDGILPRVLRARDVTRI